MRLVSGRSVVRFRSPAPRGLHVSVRPIFTFGSDILAAWWSVCAVVACSGAGAGFVLFSGVLAPGCVAGADERGRGRQLPDQGGPAASPARVLRRRLRVFGGSPAVARRRLSAWRVFQAVSIRWLRTASRHVVNSMRGARPMRRHQPRVMSLLAG